MKQVTKISDVLSNTEKAILLELLYPIGTFYKTADDNFDPNTAWGGTWELLPKDLVLWSVGSDAKGGKEFEQQVPNITGSIPLYSGNSGVSGGSVGEGRGAFSKKTKSSSNSYTGFTSHSTAPTEIMFNASDSNSAYVDNGIVRPKGIGAHIWKRTA